MYRPKHCVECGALLAPKGWRAWIGRRVCDDCARRTGHFPFARAIVGIALIALAAFALGRYLRPSPPPLIVQRSTTSPLSDLPVNLNDVSLTRRDAKENSSAKPTDETANAAADDDVVYICGARTKKGTPCRRRVHYAGQRCYQHKGMPAMMPPEKLIIK
jgi:hypothetical protein